jgi:hypothetical protein
MTYTAWSVVFGEQPSAAKWNLLGSNDASFRDGTGISNGVITPAHRTGGFVAGSYDLGAGTGSVSITGLAFAPKALITLGTTNTSGTSGTWATGYAYNNSGTPVQGAKAGGSSSTPNGFSNSSTTQAFLATSATATTFVGAITSFNSDGITVNKTTNSASQVWLIMFMG